MKSILESIQFRNGRCNVKRRMFLKSAVTGVCGAAAFGNIVAARGAVSGDASLHQLADGPAVLQSGIVTPQYFGARGEGDDSDAIEAALRSGRTIFLDRPYEIRRKITADRRKHGFGSVCLFGGGASSVLLLSTPTSGIEVCIGAPELYNPCTVELRSIRIVPAAVIPGSALKLTATGGAGSTEPTFLLSNVHVKPRNTGSYAQIGIEAHNMRIGKIEYSSVEGCRRNLIAGSKGFIFSGDVVSGVPVEAVFREVRSYFYETGWEAAGAWEGVKVLEADMIGCAVGYKASSTNANIGDSLIIENSQANVGYVGLWLEDVKNARIIHNQLTGQNWGNWSAFYGAFIRASTDSGQFLKIDGNLFDAQSIRSHRSICTGLDIDGKASSEARLGSSVGPNKFVGFDVGQSVGKNVRGAVFSSSDQFYDCRVEVRNLAKRGANQIDRSLKEY